MVRHLAGQAEPAEPAIGQVQVHLIAQAPLRPNAHDISDNQHSHDQLWIDRRSTKMAVERAQLRPHPVNVEKPVDLSKHVIGRHMLVQIEVIEQLSRCCLRSHHDRILQFPQN